MTARDTHAKSRRNDDAGRWPPLPYADWRDTCQTLHLWTQIVGKVRLALSPHVNHWWEVPLYVTSRGLTTSPMPYRGEIVEVSFDFLEHNLAITTSSGGVKRIALMPRSVAEFYDEFFTALGALGISVEINPLPAEVPHPIRCDQDHEHDAYDADAVSRFWRVLVGTDTILKAYRSHFIGKASPVHFFWGGFDLALTFFSGRPAPERPGADALTREGYSFEVISGGFWPGTDQFPHAAFYSYTAPAPEGLASAAVRPEAAFYSQELGDFLLKYEDVRTAQDPAALIRAFFDSTYEAGATLAKWDRAALERPGGITDPTRLRSMSSDAGAVSSAQAAAPAAS
jgi:hypothetical protein